MFDAAGQKFQSRGGSTFGFKFRLPEEPSARHQHVGDGAHGEHQHRRGVGEPRQIDSGSLRQMLDRGIAPVAVLLAASLRPPLASALKG
jgi:hypothetical protein